MKRNKLCDIMKNNYLIFKKTTESFLEKKTKRIVKVAFANALSSVERFFKRYFNNDLNYIIDHNNLSLFLSIYPKFENFTIDEINELIKTIKLVRNECSHFFASKTITFSQDSSIIKKIKELYKIKFLFITGTCELTLYGLFVLTSLFLDDKSIYALVNGVLLDEGIEIDFCKAFKTNRHYIRSVVYSELKKYSCLSSKYKISFLSSNIREEKNEYIDYNSTCRRELANIFFELEFGLKNRFNDFSLMLKNSNINNITSFEVDDITFLRNCWFHGVQLGDPIMYNGYEKEFSFNLILPILSKMNELFIGYDELKDTINQIELFSYEVLETKFKRAFILSYKIIDREAIDYEKINNKIAKSNRLCSKIISDDYFLTIDNIRVLKSLLNGKMFPMVLYQSKFIDNKKRIINYTGTMTIIHFLSNKKIKIDDFETDFNELYLTDISCRDKAMINGVCLDEYDLSNCVMINSAIFYKKIII